MFFFLSKTLNYLVMPLTAIVIIFVMSFVVRSAVWRTRLRILGTALLLILTNDFLANEVMKRWEVQTPAYNSMRHYRLGIVLTGTMIPQLQPDDRVYFSRGADRVVHTVQLYKLGIIDKILVSGGSGRLIDIQEREADRFREVMMLMGVPDSVILIENQTRNTHESARAVKKMLETLQYSEKECLLITSAFHMRRALACYRKVGLPLDTFTSDFYAHHNSYSLDSYFIPRLDALIIWHKLVKEWIGITAYWIAGYV